MNRLTIASLKKVCAAIVVGSLLCVVPVSAGEIQKHGDAFVVYLPGNLDYLEVVDRLKTEIMAANWEITDVQDIDVGLGILGNRAFVHRRRCGSRRCHPWDLSSSDPERSTCFK